MSEIILPGDGLLFMKVGIHAQESLEDILERKNKEIADAGVAFWGYGGNTCHPRTMVQPFVKQFEAKGNRIRLFMQEIDSNHFAEPVRADEYSEDGINWKSIHKDIHVRGSRYALVIKGLRKAEVDIPIEHTKVAIGLSEGQSGGKYIQGRVDKGCLVLASAPPTSESSVVPRIIKTQLVADIVEPYAVFLRNTPS